MRYFQRALKIQQKMLHDNHPNIAATYENIGECCLKTNDKQGAINAYQSALKIHMKNSDTERIESVKKQLKLCENIAADTPKQR